MDFDQGEPIRVFSVPGEGGNYVEGAMRDFLASKHQGLEETFRTMAVSELKGRLNDTHSDVVDALSARIEGDYRTKKLRPIEGRPAPAVPVQGQAEPDEVTTYTFKRKTLTQTEHQADGKISFGAEPGLNAVVRIQRKDKSTGELLEAFDTVEYKNGQVAALVIGKGGPNSESRLADIGLMRSQIRGKGGIDVSGVLSEEVVQERHAEEPRAVAEAGFTGASVRENESRAKEKMERARAEADVSVLRKRPASFNMEDSNDFSVFRTAPSTPPVASSKKKGRGGVD